MGLLWLFLKFDAVMLLAISLIYLLSTYQSINLYRVFVKGNTPFKVEMFLFIIALPTMFNVIIEPNPVIITEFVILFISSLYYGFGLFVEDTVKETHNESDVKPFDEFVIQTYKYQLAAMSSILIWFNITILIFN